MNMKKKLIAVLAGAMVISSLAGCSKLSGSKELSNDNIKISQYKGVEAEKAEIAEVTEENVDEEIQSVLYANRIVNDVSDRPAQSGDTVSINYTGTSEGEEFDSGTLDVEIGSGSMIPGFEDGLIGHSVGESFELNLTFPESYTPELAGKPAVFAITVNSITTYTLPELNDQFVQDVSEDAKTVEEFKKNIKKELKEKNEEAARTSLENNAWQVVLDNTEVKKYPEKQVQEQKEALIAQYKQLAEMNGLEFADFLSQAMNGMTEETFESEAEKVAKQTVKQSLAVDLIMKKEKLELSEKELDNVMKEYKEKFGFESVDAMKESIGEDALLADIHLSTVKTWVADNCKPVEKTSK